MATEINNTNYQKLKNVLKEVFQLDQADLDFGIYRIMNQKREDITDFLDNRLLPQVKDVLAKNGSGNNAKIQEELNTAIEQAKSLGVDPNTLPKVQELQSKLANSISVDGLEQEVYSHLANFFKRYYKDGDFISLRRYKKDVYAIPYEGEEVKLHWANHDQYYIKTSEYLKNYGFKITGNKSVKIALKEASTEQNNNKEQSGKERRFEIFEEQPVEVSENGNTLTLNFTYEQHDKKVKQDKLISEALTTIVSNLPSEFNDVLALAPTEKNKKRTLLEKHLNDFSARNTFDYFIHKDLGGFLSRELDFYIKNEVLYLDDINTDNEQDFTAQLSKVKALKQVAQKIITFLAQLENFQKKLWLKKKFVVSTNYCITLDRIPESYYPEIASNKEQLEEWKELFKIHEQKDDLLTVAYSEPLTIDFLKKQPYLVLDTKFFAQEFKDKLLAEFDDLDKQTNGLLINSENFQAIELIKNKYNDRIKHVYIDPPFNLGQNKNFLYKTDFLDSSWLSLLQDRINSSKGLVKKDGSYSVRCDYHGNYLVRSLMNKYFSSDNFRNELYVNRIFKNKNLNAVKTLSYTYDSLFFYSITNAFEFVNPVMKLKQTRESYWRHMNDSEGQGSAKTFFGIELEPPIGKHWKYGQENIDKKINIGELRLDCKNCKHIHTEGNIDSCPSCGSINLNPKYLVHATDEKVLGTSWGDISGYSNTTGFSTENAEELLNRIIQISTNEGDYVLDYFAGSGTTQSVAHKLNRKWIGVEMGKYFDFYTKNRLKKVLANKHTGITKKHKIPYKGGLFKYIELESYEDVLNNLRLNTSANQSSMLTNKDFNDEYMLNYMLDVESRGSLLNIEAFQNPFNYKLNITRDNESQETIIDLVETFNYLIGLHVNTIQTIKGFKVITGVTNDRKEETLVIWRNTVEKSNADLNDFFSKMEFSTRDTEFDRIYVNGDNHLENLKIGDEKWKVVLIEEVFNTKI